MLLFFCEIESDAYQLWQSVFAAAFVLRTTGLCLGLLGRAVLLLCGVDGVDRMDRGLLVTARLRGTTLGGVLRALGGALGLLATLRGVLARLAGHDPELFFRFKYRSFGP